MSSEPGQRASRAFYGLFAADYEAHAAVSAYNALYDRPAVLRLLGPVDGRRVLDAGCGPGLPLPQPAMADQYPEAFDKLGREPAFILFRLVKAYS
ncbi:MAG: hypothetical protein ACRDY2_00765 [Acidimicrobiales bacterium]